MVEENGKFGLIDTTGKFVISPHHDFLKDLHLGVASARSGDLWGMIDIHDNRITPFEFDEIVREPYGIIAVRKDQKWGIMAPDGRILGGFLYNSVRVLDGDKGLFSSFDENKIDEDRGYAVVAQDEKLGVVDAKGKLVLQTKFDDIHSFTNGVALGRQGNKWAVADTSGMLLTDFVYDWLQIHGRHGRCLKDFGIILYHRYMGCGLMSKSGKEITPPDYQDIETAADNYYIVTHHNKRGVIDATGKILLPIKYDRIVLQVQSLDFSFRKLIFLNDLCTVVADGKLGYVSKAGVEYFD